MKNVVGMFDSLDDARAAVQDLHDAGFSRNDISFIATQREGLTVDRDEQTRANEQNDTLAGEGAGIGATGGAVTGGLIGLLLAPAAFVLPGIGPVLVAGTLAATLTTTAVGAGIGAAVGGLVGALVGAGIPEEHAHAYSEGVRRGGGVVMVQTDDNDASRVTDILRRHNIVDIEQRAGEYQKTGWTRFDETAEPYRGNARSV